jgi:Immunity protein 17
MDVAALAPLVPVAQFFVGLPLAYTAGSFALTATYESEEECLTVLFCAAVGLLMFLSGVFNWEWFFNYGRIGRRTRHLGPHVARMLYILIGTFMVALMTVGSSNSRPFSERMWPLNGPVIEEALPDHMPKPKTGSDRMRAPGARRPPGF